MGEEKQLTAGTPESDLTHPLPLGANDLALAPWTYPLRGRILCWLFWKCWLNPAYWVLRIFCPRKNPYRRVVAVYDPVTWELMRRRASHVQGDEAPEGLAGSGEEGGRRD